MSPVCAESVSLVPRAPRHFAVPHAQCFTPCRKGEVPALLFGEIADLPLCEGGQYCCDLASSGVGEGLSASPARVLLQGSETCTPSTGLTPRV